VVFFALVPRTLSNPLGVLRAPNRVRTIASPLPAETLQGEASTRTRHAIILTLHHPKKGGVFCARATYAFEPTRAQAEASFFCLVSLCRIEFSLRVRANRVRIPREAVWELAHKRQAWVYSSLMKYPYFFFTPPEKGWCFLRSCHVRFRTHSRAS